MDPDYTSLPTPLARAIRSFMDFAPFRLNFDVQRDLEFHFAFSAMVISETVTGNAILEIPMPVKFASSSRLWQLNP